MATWFIRTDGTDSIAGVANGRDAHGFALSNATYDHAGGSTYSNRELTAASGTPFSGASAGEDIYLLNAAGGVADGLYRIQAVDGGGAIIQLEDDSGLTADSTSDVDSSDGPFATIQYAIDASSGNTNAANGDEFILCANADHGTASDILADELGGSDVLPIRFTGASATGVKGTVAKIIATDAAVTNLMNFSRDHWWVKDIIFDGGGSNEANIPLYFTGGDFIGVNLRATNGSSNGCDARGTRHRLINCEFDNNTLRGMESAGAPSSCFYSGCSWHHNGTHGADVRGDYHTFYDCKFFSNGSDRCNVQADREQSVFINCTFEGNASDGLFFNSGNNSVIINCSSSNNGGYNYELDASTNARPWRFGWNHSYNGTSGHLNNIADSAFANFGMGNNITGDPGYTTVTDDAEDYTPLANSILVAAGLGVSSAGGSTPSDIGAVQMPHHADNYPAHRIFT